MSEITDSIKTLRTIQGEPVRQIHKKQERLSLHVPVPQIACALALAMMGMMLLTPRTASAQASAGITGTVTDTTGAVVRGAHVTITNEGTSASDRTVTESAGTFSFKGVLPGRYTVAVDAAGFKKEVQKGVNVEVSSNATVDFALNAGGNNETVQVAAEQLTLNTTQPELGSTIEPIVVEALPEEVSGRGRQIDQLQFLAPGTTGSTFSHRVSGGVDFSQEIVYNGIPAPQPETEGYTTNFNPPFDLVQEYKVERSTFSAQYGLGQGALTYQMKSGTNHYHGSAFEINRNNLFDSVGFFNGHAWNSANPTDKTIPDHENNYGFSIAGPIRIPHLYDGRNKTFGHYSQEWYKQNAEDTSPGTVPTALEKTGDFSDFQGIDPVTKQQVVIPIYDPQTGLQFMGCDGTHPNVICSSRFSPLAQSLIQYIPDPDKQGSGVAGLDQNKNFVPNAIPNIQHVWGFTLDQTLTPTQSLHYSEWRNTFHNSGFDQSPIVPITNPLESQRYYPNIGSAFLLNYTNALTSHLVMTAGFGWIGEINNQFNLAKTAPQPSYFGVLNEDIFPSITFGGLHAPTSWGTGGSNSGSVNRKLGVAVVNNWLWTKGRNTFNIGGEIRRSLQDDNEEQTEGGHFAFSQNETSIHNSTDPNFGSYGSSFASFLLGLPDEEDRSGSQEESLRNLAVSPYVQDDIKLTPKLTLNLGVRWDIQVPFTEKHDAIVYFNQDNPGTDPAASGIAGSLTKFGSCTGCAGYERADIHWGHFGPRFGFAYKLNNKMVIQGGLNVAFLDGGAYEYGTNKVAVNYGNLLNGQYHRPSSGSYTSAPGSWDTNPIPGLALTPFSPGLGSGNQVDSFSKKDGYAPYSQQWNINLQRELPYSMFLEAAWVGNRVIHLPSQNNRIDQMDPAYDSQYGGVLSTCAANAGNSVLTDTFSSGCAQQDGFTAPYANFVNDFGGSSTVEQALVPYPQYSYIFNNFEGFGTTYYQSAQIELEKRFTNGLSFLAGYTLSHLMDNTSSGFSSFTSGGINKYNQKPEWAVSNSDEPQTLKVSGTYELPIGPGKKYLNNHLTGNILGGWQVGWILDYENGGDLGVGENGSPFPNGFERPDRNASVGLSTASYNRVRDYFVGKAPKAQVLSTGGFTLTPSQYVIGTATRNYSELRSPGLAVENLNARKHIYMGERLQGILTVDYFNAFNRTQFEGPDTNYSDGTFGQVTSQGSQISNRQGQITFRLEF
jgi:hypothetical protein